MKVISDNYIIKTQLPFSEKRKFLSFSDIHYGVLQQLFYKGIMRKFFDYLAKTNKGVDAILIPGDLIFYLFKMEDAKFLKELKIDLMNLSFKLGVPIYISYGNHDLPFNQEKLNDLDKYKQDLGYCIDDRSEGIYVLDNEQARLGNTIITGFSPTRDAYNPSFMPDKSLKIAFDSFRNCGFQFSKDDLNILMSHDNKFFTYPMAIGEYGELYESLDAIIGGHLHDGYMPIWFQKMYGEKLKDYGIWETIPPKIDMCRGAFKVSANGKSTMILPDLNKSVEIGLNSNEAVSIVNRGVAKYSWFIPSVLSYTTMSFEGDMEQDRGKSKILK